MNTFSHFSEIDIVFHEKTVFMQGYPQAPDSKVVLNKDGSLNEEKSDVIEAPDGTLLLTETEEPEETFEKKILRVDSETQEPLPGAVIQLLDEEGNVLKEWTSSDEAPEIVTGLRPGTIYSIHEITAPWRRRPAACRISASYRRISNRWSRSGATCSRLSCARPSDGPRAHPWDR